MRELPSRTAYRISGPTLFPYECRYFPGRIASSRDITRRSPIDHTQRAILSLRICAMSRIRRTAVLRSSSALKSATLIGAYQRRHRKPAQSLAYADPSLSVVGVSPLAGVLAMRVNAEASLSDPRGD